MTRQTWTMLFALSLLFAFSFAFVKTAVAEIPPVTLVLLRVGGASLALAPVLLLTRTPFPRGRKLWRAFFGMAVLNNVLPWCLFFWAQRSLPTGLGAILNATTPFFAVVVGHFMLADERMSVNKLGGVLVGMFGVAVLVGPSALALDAAFLPEVAFMIAALSYAFSGVIGRRFAGFGISPLQTAWGQLTASAILVAPLAALDRPWAQPMPSQQAWLAVAGLAVLCTALAYILFFRILVRAGSTNVMLVTFLVPPSAIFVGAVFLDERLDPRAFVGMAFIALGLGLIDGRPLRWLRTRLLGPARPDAPEAESR